MAEYIEINRLKEILRYEEDGNFYWIKAPSNRVNTGGMAGSTTRYGYITIRVDGVAYLAHRLAWFYTYGIWPKLEIDHINGNRLDNRIINLRDVSRSCNAQNFRKANKQSKTQILGVSYCAVVKKYVATITVDRTKRILGYFDTTSDAAASYLSAKRLLHPGCTI